MVAGQVLSNLLGVDDANADKKAEKLATKLGLKPENTLAQTAVYLVTKAAVLEGLQLIGIGGGLAKGDLGGFQMAQLMAKVNEINEKLDIVLTAPLKEAEEFLGMAMIHLANGKVAASIEELKKVKDKAVQAFQYNKGLGKSESLRNAVKTKQLKIFAEVIIQSYDGSKIIPFCHLDKEQKRVISSLIEADLKAIQEFFDTHNISRLTWWNKEKNEKKKQDLLDSLLCASYPYISEGRGFTIELADVELPHDLKVLPHTLPDGEEDAALITVGQREGKSVMAKVWRDGEVAKARMVTDERDGEITIEKIRGSGEVVLKLEGNFII